MIIQDTKQLSCQIIFIIMECFSLRKSFLNSGDYPFSTCWLLLRMGRWWIVNHQTETNLGDSTWTYRLNKIYSLQSTIFAFGNLVRTGATNCPFPNYLSTKLIVFYQFQGESGWERSFLRCVQGMRLQSIRLWARAIEEAWCQQGERRFLGRWCQ